jgi:NTE family protein
MSGERSGRRKVALVMSGGGARGAYEAGVLSHFFEAVIPRLRPGFDFDILSGTSIGAIHATFTAATSGLEPAERAARLSRTWSTMSIGDVLHLTAGDLVKVPLRAMGFSTISRAGQGVFGGLVDVSPLEELVQKTIPWDQLARNMASGAPRAVCVSCTEVRSGRVTVFMDGRDANPAPWSHDPNAQAIAEPITDRHVRASAAIPFLFPAVSVNDRYYVDGGLRMNTPLSPALRLGADRVLVIALKHSPGLSTDHPPYPESVITQPAFLLGKVLDALTLDQLEYELNRVELVNSLIDQGEDVYGDGFLDSINVAIRKKRGVGFRHVKTCIVRPSEDIGKLAADCHREQGGMRALGSGLPDDEADLLSYLYFDGRFTKRLIEMGREDARAAEFDVMELLSD